MTSPACARPASPSRADEGGMRRALVIGISGAGKSTFSKRLAEATRLPLIHLDREFWQPGWNVTLREPWRAKVKQLAQRESWIMDGNFDSSLDLRLPRADTVFWFDSLPSPRPVANGCHLRAGAQRPRAGLPRAMGPAISALCLEFQCPRQERCGRRARALRQACRVARVSTGCGREAIPRNACRLGQDTRRRCRPSAR
jgi:hypothetical protein